MIITQYPYIDDFGHERFGLVRFYSDNPDMNLQQVETGFIYSEAIDAYPSRYTYIEIEKEKNEEEEEEHDTGHTDTTVQGNG